VTRNMSLSSRFIAARGRTTSKLPVIAVPLLPGDPEVALDLQAAFDRSYDAGPYDRAVLYDMATVEPPLRPDQQEWVKARLAAEQV